MLRGRKKGIQSKGSCLKRARGEPEGSNNKKLPPRGGSLQRGEGSPFEKKISKRFTHITQGNISLFLKSKRVGIHSFGASEIFVGASGQSRNSEQLKNRNFIKKPPGDATNEEHMRKTNRRCYGVK